MSLPLPLEHAIQTQIMQYLRMRGWFVMRLNSGAIRSISHTGKQHMMRLSPAGTPDLMAFKRIEEKRPPSIGVWYPMLLFVEVKRSPKHKPTPLQLAKMEELRGFGAICVVASSIEDVVRVIDN